MITKALASTYNGNGTTLDLWNRWSALVLVRAALRRQPDHSEILPEAARKLFRSQGPREKAPLSAPPGNGALPAIDAEIARTRAEIDEAGPSSIDLFARRLHLSAEERDVVAFLFSTAASPFVSSLRTRLDLGDADYKGISIGFVIDALFPDAGPGRAVASRRLFHPAERLVSNEILKLEHCRYSLDEPDLISMEVELSPRIVNSLLGDESSYVLLSAFLEADIPDVQMDELVLASGLKERVSGLVEAWISRRDQVGLREPLSFLFYGPPGTGKTLLAQALASKFRLPLVRMRGLGSGQRRGNRFGDSWFDTEDIVRFVLREANALGGIALFDECDDIFTNDSAESRSLLLELERHKGIAVLATNSAGRLDKALDRRMSLRIPFSLPGREERRRIWEVHVSRHAPGVEGVDLAELANSFAFAGGYIRNAVRLAALRAGLGRPIRQTELLGAAEEQAVHFTEDTANCIIAGAELPECSADSRTAIEGVARVAAVAQARGETLKICIRGRSMEDLRSAAAGLAWRLKLGTLFCRSSALQGGADAPRDGKGSGVNQDAVSLLISALPSDCALAVQDSDGGEGAELVDEISRMRSGLYFHLDAGRRRKARAGGAHFTIALEPPDPATRARLWKRALEREGGVCEEHFAHELASLRALGAAEIEELARVARWKSLVAGRSQIDASDVTAAIHEFMQSFGTPPLFGI
jgi:hypothetical protein